MIHFFVGEKWKEIKLDFPTKNRYAISNFGRLVSFTDKIKNGRLLRGSRVEDYPNLAFKIRKNKKVIYRRYFLHTLVAKSFISKKSKNQKHVMHFDFNRENNHYSNLRWVTLHEMAEHQNKNPRVIAGRKKAVAAKRGQGHKLNNAKVLAIKKKLFNRKSQTTLRAIAKQFRISDMQVHRIRTGENWAHVKVKSN